MYLNLGLRILACDFGTACFIRLSKFFCFLLLKLGLCHSLVKQNCLFVLVNWGFPQIVLPTLCYLNIFSKGFQSPQAILIVSYLRRRKTLQFSDAKLIKLCSTLKRFGGRIVVVSIKTEHLWGGRLA